MLNFLWAGMIGAGILWAAFHGNLEAVTNGALESAKEAVTLCISMLGILSFWCGILKIGEKAGLVEELTKRMRPVIRFLFPDLPEGHPAAAHIATNMIANILGLGWAATPAGLAAMESLEKLEEERRLAAETTEAAEAMEAAGAAEIAGAAETTKSAEIAKPAEITKSAETAEAAKTAKAAEPWASGEGCKEKQGAELCADRQPRRGSGGIRPERGRKKSPAPRQTASDEMCTFLIINISSLQLLPINMIAYRSQYGSVSPAAIAGPALAATLVSTGIAVLFCKLVRQTRGGISR